MKNRWASEYPFRLLGRAALSNSPAGKAGSIAIIHVQAETVVFFASTEKEAGK